jgi:hypothetical protein
MNENLHFVSNYLTRQTVIVTKRKRILSSYEHIYLKIRANYKKRLSKSAIWEGENIYKVSHNANLN